MTATSGHVHLLRSDLTGLVYVVTRHRAHGRGETVEALQKHDVTDEFVALLGLDRADLEAEIRRQDRRFGHVRHTAEGWLACLAEEVGEVGREVTAFMPPRGRSPDPANYRVELIQVAAVAMRTAAALRAGEILTSGIGKPLTEFLGFCPRCEGCGEIMQDPSTGPIYADCPDCRGTGRKDHE